MATPEVLKREIKALATDRGGHAVPQAQWLGRQCCCQPEAIIIAAIVAPAGDCNIAMTRDCFEPGSALCGRGGLAIASGDGFAAVASVCAGRGDRFFADFDIEILRFG